MSPGENTDGRVLVTAPLGRDAELIASLLRKAGIASQECRTVAELASAMNEGAGAAIVAEEFLGPAHVASLEVEGVQELGWWSADELRSAGVVTTPRDLPALLDRIAAGSLPSEDEDLGV